MAARRVLVTGGGGFVGRHALPALLARGFEVHALGRTQLDHAPPAVIQHRIDLLQDDDGLDCVAELQATHLLHFAWDVRPGLFWRSPENLDWVGASLRLYRRFAAAGGRRVVAAGSCAEYDWNHDWLDEANTPLRPSTLYGTAKDALHRVLRSAASQDGITLGWGRLFFLYGPHEAPSRLVASIAQSLAQGEPALCGDGLAQRDFMRSEDAGAAFATLVDSDFDGPVNIASGSCVPIADVAQTLARLAGRPDLLRLGARPSVVEPARLAAATDRLQHQLGFRPGATLEQGLDATLKWWIGRQSV